LLHFFWFIFGVVQVVVKNIVGNLPKLKQSLLQKCFSFPMVAAAFLQAGGDKRDTRWGGRKEVIARIRQVYL